MTSQHCNYQCTTYDFLPFHPPVLVPGFHLQLTEAQRFGQIYSARNKNTSTHFNIYNVNTELSHASDHFNV